MSTPETAACPDCGSTATTCWERKDAAIEDLENQIRELKYELRQADHLSGRDSEEIVDLHRALEKQENEIREEWSEQAKDGASLFQELFTLCEQRMTGADKWAELDLSNLGKRIKKWIETNK